jgi:hypothetical protein
MRKAAEIQTLSCPCPTSSCKAPRSQRSGQRSRGIGISLGLFVRKFKFCEPRYQRLIPRDRGRGAGTVWPKKLIARSILPRLSAIDADGASDEEDRPHDASHGIQSGLKSLCSVLGVSRPFGRLPKTK